jgi:hypothetical protein
MAKKRRKRKFTVRFARKKLNAVVDLVDKRLLGEAQPSRTDCLLVLHTAIVACEIIVTNCSHYYIEARACDIIRICEWYFNEIRCSMKRPPPLDCFERLYPMPVSVLSLHVVPR